MQKHIETYFLKNKFTMKSHVTTCHYLLFFYKNPWVVLHPWLTGKKNKPKTVLIWVFFLKTMCYPYFFLLTKELLSDCL